MWSQRKLGRLGELVYLALSDEPIPSVSMLAMRLGRSWAGVNKALLRLQEHGLADWVEGGWVRGKRALADVARELEVAAAATKRHRKHKADRERRQRS